MSCFKTSQSLLCSLKIVPARSACRLFLDFFSQMKIAFEVYCAAIDVIRDWMQQSVPAGGKQMLRLRKTGSLMASTEY